METRSISQSPNKDREPLQSWYVQETMRCLVALGPWQTNIGVMCLPGAFCYNTDTRTHLAQLVQLATLCFQISTNGCLKFLLGMDNPLQ